MSDSQGRGLPRRSVAGLLSLMPLASGAADAAEADNVTFVNRFCADWSTKDVEKLIPYLAPEIEYHIFEGGPVVKGVEQFRKQLGPYMAGMREITWETSRSAAMGDLVINERLDHFLQPAGSGKPDSHFHVAGVFIVRGGKIVYWKDWTMPKAG